MTEQPQIDDFNHRQAGFYRLERLRAGDFPYYRDGPEALAGRDWIVILLGSVLGFAALIAPLPFFRSVSGGVISAILFAAIPLGALAAVAGRGWTRLFRPLCLSDLVLMAAIAFLNLIVAVAVVLILRSVFEMDANPVTGMLGGFSGSERFLFYLKTLPQLFGEELVSILPFLAILWLCRTKSGLSRRWAIIVAWFGAALWFGALHLSTYNWNFAQCFLVIGTARLVLLTGYLITKNIWVSAGAHIVNDWLIFTLILLFPNSLEAG